MKVKKSGCKFVVQYDKTHIQCAVDGSIRSIGRGCPCAFYKPSFWAKIKNIFTLQND